MPAPKSLQGRDRRSTCRAECCAGAEMRPATAGVHEQNPWSRGHPGRTHTNAPRCHFNHALPALILARGQPPSDVILRGLIQDLTRRRSAEGIRARVSACTLGETLGGGEVRREAQRIAGRYPWRTRRKVVGVRHARTSHSRRRRRSSDQTGQGANQTGRQAHEDGRVWIDKGSASDQ